MSSHVWDASIETATEYGLLTTLLSHPVRIPMMQMRNVIVTGLRDRGLIVCGQEMVNCIGIHAHDGDVIISGEPSLYCWLVIKPAGREWLAEREAHEICVVTELKAKEITHAG